MKTESTNSRFHKNCAVSRRRATVDLLDKWMSAHKSTWVYLKRRCGSNHNRPISSRGTVGAQIQLQYFLSFFSRQNHIGASTCCSQHCSLGWPRRRSDDCLLVSPTVCMEQGGMTKMLTRPLGDNHQIQPVLLLCSWINHNKRPQIQADTSQDLSPL